MNKPAGLYYNKSNAAFSSAMDIDMDDATGMQDADN
eukprot:CAMPEP_0116887810 /NCGR_PEP_ID=MMETSP0463-20121206/22491_1 /TAXON_ID=181622 /ORGANISM="Strombidinopsis sp, Strain SopsisLIS2011" /LENGTH=35 /DNA_ID= /DNA_START= /DNA_END= /DNA_ORIENTATION=